MKSRKIIPIILTLCLALLACFAFSGCAGSGSGPVKYKDDVATKAIADAIAAAKPDVDFAEMTEGYVENAMSLDISKFSEYVVLVSSGGANIDQFGVFKTAEGVEPQELQKALEDYLKLCKERWMDEYLPEEKPKLETASVKICGNYGIYCIFNEADREAAFKTFEDMLK